MPVREEAAGVEAATDTQLAMRSQQGDRAAFETLAGRWQGRLHGFLTRLLGDEEAARDACQETLVKAYLNIGRLREPHHFKAWIHQIALNLSRDAGRAAPRLAAVPLPDILTGDTEAELVDAAPGPDRVAEEADLRAVLRRVLSHLPEAQRTAILLREYQGLNAVEIARITGVPAATVRTRIFHGLRTLRRLLPEHGVAPMTPSNPGEGP
jgi:RNA polymerase sigma-70 factor (ECF subfamily)